MNTPKIQVLKQLASHAKMLMGSPDAAVAAAAADEHADLAEKLATAMNEAAQQQQHPQAA